MRFLLGKQNEYRLTFAHMRLIREILSLGVAEFM